MVKGKLEPYQFLPAGNFTSRGFEADGAVIHYTGGGNGRKTAHWARGKIGRSWHFLICRDGHVIQQVELHHKAWHAGRSYWPHTSGESLGSANNYAVGIEIANFGALEYVGGRFNYEINGELYRYHGPQPIEATLEWDNGVKVTDWWEPYTDEQYASLDLLLERLKQKGVPMNLMGHEEIALPYAFRKMDPGPLFDWDRYGRPEGRRTEGRIIVS